MRQGQDSQNGSDGGSGSGGLGKSATRAYQSAAEAAFVLPIGMLLGAGLDWWLETDPWLMMIGLGLGFTAMIRILMRMRKLVEAASEEHADDQSQ